MIGKPEHVKKMISVKFDQTKGQYMGLPTMWRELLEMPLDVSKQEIKTDDWDENVAPAMPSTYHLYRI